jgi:glycerophosphoryl diester phosphodiesterase
MRWRRVIGVLTVGVGALWLGNTSLLVAPEPDARVQLLAHRGAHQIYAAGPPGRDTCTADPIEEPSHEFLENTIPSMQAAFDAGAEVVELDIHLTPDDVFVVFHDWTLECRTDGTEQTNETPWAELQNLDIGHGYVTVSGETPFRGAGRMPTLEEVFEAFPVGQFLINFKSDRVSEGRALVRLLNENPAYNEAIWGVYGGGPPVAVVVEEIPDIPGFDRARVQDCIVRYAGLGWSGYVPEACRDTLIMVPQNVAPFLWGWPTRFERRMARYGSEVILVGPYGGAGFTAGIDDAALLADVPDGFGGWVWTNRILEMAPLVER